MEETRHWVVSGRVQGVGFRAWTRHQAMLLDLRGWAKNLPDGRVEVMALGRAAELDALRARLAQGPPAGRVGEIEEARPSADDKASARALDRFVLR